MWLILLIALAMLAVAGALLYAASVFKSKEIVYMPPLNLGPLSMSVADLETRATPDSSSGADQAAVDQLTERVQSVADRFAKVAPPVQAAPVVEVPVVDQAEAGGKSN